MEGWSQKRPAPLTSPRAIRESGEGSFNREDDGGDQACAVRRVSVRGGDGLLRTGGQKRVDGPSELRQLDGLQRDAEHRRPNSSHWMFWSCKSSPGRMHRNVRPWPALAVCRRHQCEVGLPAAAPISPLAIHHRSCSPSAVRILVGAVELQS